MFSVCFHHAAPQLAAAAEKLATPVRVVYLSNAEEYWNALPAGFRSNVERVAHRPVVDAHIADSFSGLTREQCAARLRAANTAFGFVNDVAAFSRHPALRRVSLATPNGPVAVAAPTIRLPSRAATSTPSGASMNSRR